MEREHRVTPLELFFDLVFVFGFTQVTLLLWDDPTWLGLGHGPMILAALWSARASYAWLTNTADAGLDAVLAALLVAMAAMFVAAIACALLFPVALAAPALVALVAGVWVALHAYELIRFREARADTTALRAPASVG